MRTEDGREPWGRELWDQGWGRGRETSASRREAAGRWQEQGAGDWSVSCCCPHVSQLPTASPAIVQQPRGCGDRLPFLPASGCPSSPAPSPPPVPSCCAVCHRLPRAMGLGHHPLLPALTPTKVGNSNWLIPSQRGATSISPGASVGLGLGSSPAQMGTVTAVRAKGSGHPRLPHRLPA